MQNRVVMKSIDSGAKLHGFELLLSNPSLGK